MNTRMFSILILLLAALSIPIPAYADGVILPEPPVCDPGPCPSPPPLSQLVIRYHRVTVTIQDQVAVTHVDQVFYNPNRWTVEGTYVFPIPADAAVSDFTLWIDGAPVKGQVLDAEQARQTYEDIVRQMRDPALLEYAGRGAVQAQVFPIQAQEERRVELEYTQVLSADHGLVHYVYPLNTEKFSAQPLEQVSIHISVQAASPIRAVYSPSHPIDLQRLSDNDVLASYSEQDVLPDADFSLFYSIGEGPAFHLLTYRDPSDEADPDGFFLLLLAPRLDQPEAAIPKDVLLVLDRSGSMDGEKFQQAQQALIYVLQHLNPLDRFNLIAFSTDLETYAAGLRPASEAASAITWVNGLSAQGKTDINRALLEAAGMVTTGVVQERPTYLIFLTDGLPTEGTVDSQQILENFAASVPPGLRTFTFGVGYDVDTFLLDSLAQAHHGSSFYVVPGEHLDEALSSFYARISTPVLTDLSLDFGGMAVYDIYPDPLPDLFRGSQVVVVGRYRKGGKTTITLSGKANGELQTFHIEDQVFNVDRQAAGGAPQEAIPRLWATRKVGFLLNRIRLDRPDQETIDQIVKLSIRYGIVTPYTSYLVTETAPLGVEEQDRIAAQEYNQLLAAPPPATSGQAAVEKAAGQGALSDAQAPQAPPAEATDLVRVVGAHTFVYVDNTWVDTAYDPENMQPLPVEFLSQAYFDLAAADSQLAAAFALGPRVIAIAGGVPYEVISAGLSAGPGDEPVTLVPSPTASPVDTTLTSTGTPSPVPPGDPGAAQPSCLGGLFGLILLPLAVWGITLRMIAWRDASGG